MKNLCTVLFISIFIFSCGDSNCVQGNCTDGHGKYVDEFSIYEGNFDKQGRYDGQGNLYYKEYDVSFVGQFYMGMFLSGKVIFSDGRVWEGEYEKLSSYFWKKQNDGKGIEGIMTYPNGTIQEGYWKTDKVDKDSQKWGLYFNGKFQEILDWY